MNPSTQEPFESTMARVNAQEHSARSDYFAYLTKQGDLTDTLDEFMVKYASLARFDTPASTATIERLRHISGPALPKSLVEFNRNQGAFHSGDRMQQLVIHSADELVAKAQADVPQWDSIRTIGLVDMIVLSWGGDRPEFDPATGEGLTQPEVDAFLQQSEASMALYEALQAMLKGALPRPR